MKCPVCAAKCRVTNTRPVEENIVKRKRECTKCFAAFDTYETADYDSLPDYFKRKIKNEEKIL